MAGCDGIAIDSDTLPPTMRGRSATEMAEDVRRAYRRRRRALAFWRWMPGSWAPLGLAGAILLAVGASLWIHAATVAASSWPYAPVPNEWLGDDFQTALKTAGLAAGAFGLVLWGYAILTAPAVSDRLGAKQRRFFNLVSALLLAGGLVVWLRVEQLASSPIVQGLLPASYATSQDAFAALSVLATSSVTFAIANLFLLSWHGRRFYGSGFGVNLGSFPRFAATVIAGAYAVLAIIHFSNGFGIDGLGLPFTDIRVIAACPSQTSDWWAWVDRSPLVEALSGLANASQIAEFVCSGELRELL